MRLRVDVILDEKLTDKFKKLKNNNGIQLTNSQVIRLLLNEVK